MPVDGSPVTIAATDADDQPTRTPELEELYRGFESELLIPLWTEIGDLMPSSPRSRAVPHLWRWSRLLPMAEQAGRLVPVGRGGERRAIALANPGLGGRPRTLRQGARARSLAVNDSAYDGEVSRSAAAIRRREPDRSRTPLCGTCGSWGGQPMWG